MDGVPEHGESAALAGEIASRCNAAIHLAVVIPTPETLTGEVAATARMLPTSMEAILNMSANSAKDYLTDEMMRMQSGGITVTGEILRGDPATELARLANSRSDGMIVLATHGHAGTSAFWSHSTTARILGKVRIPALLIPVTNRERDS